MKLLTRLVAATAFASASLLVGQTVTSVVNAADGSNALSPGTVILIRGTNLADLTVAAPSLPAPASLGGVSVQFVAADGSTSSLPILAISPTEIRSQLPYDVAVGAGAVQATGANSVGVSLDAISPRLITDFATGDGDLLMYHSDNSPVTRLAPARPGETVIVYAHGMGQTNPPAVAGEDPGMNPPKVVVLPVSVTFNGLATQVNEARLLELNPGVYRMSVTLPYDDRVGTVPVILQTGTVTSQTNAVAPFMANGFYYQILANNPPAPIALNGLSGSTSAIATRQDDLNYWGVNGFRNWTKSTGLPSQFEPIRGIAVTLRNGNITAFANHGIEDQNGAFYNNANGVPDGEFPGLLTIFSMSDLYNFVGGGFFRLSQPATFDTIIGYFDGDGDRDLPLDPNSPYIRYRMNIWSNVSTTNVPSETGTFVGDVMSSDTASGTWSWSYTGVDRVFRDIPTLNSDLSRRDDPIFRMVYKLDQPLTLPAGDYWFSHDAVVPAAVGAFGFTGSSPITNLSVVSGNREPVRPRESAAGERALPPAFLRMIP